jgi:hypothetical protein
MPGRDPGGQSRDSHVTRAVEPQGAAGRDPREDESGDIRGAAVRQKSPADGKRAPLTLYALSFSAFAQLSNEHLFLYIGGALPVTLPVRQKSHKKEP